MVRRRTGSRICVLTVEPHTVRETSRIAAATAARALAREVAQDVLARYAWGFTQNDPTILRDCFSQEAVVVFPDGARTGRAEILAELARRQQDWPGEWVYTNNIMIDRFDADEVRARASTAIIRGRGPERFDFSLVGWYEDVYRIEDERWCIAHRVVFIGNGRPRS